MERPVITDPSLRKAYHKANARGRFKYQRDNITIHIKKNKMKSHIFDYYAKNYRSKCKHFEGDIHVMQTMYVALGNFIRIWLHDYDSTMELHRVHKSFRLYEVQHIRNAQVDEELDRELRDLPMDEKLEQIIKPKKTGNDKISVEYAAEAGEKYEILIKIFERKKGLFEIKIEKTQFDLNPGSKYHDTFKLGHLSLDSDELVTMHRAIGDCLLHNSNLKPGLKEFFRKKIDTTRDFSRIDSTIRPYPPVKGADNEVDSVSGESSDDEVIANVSKSELQKAKTDVQFQEYRFEKTHHEEGKTSAPPNKLDALENLKSDAVVSYAAIDMWIKLTKQNFSAKQTSEIILMSTDFCSTLTKKGYKYNKHGAEFAKEIDLSTNTIKLLIVPFRYENGDWILLVAKFARENLNHDCDNDNVTSIYVSELQPRNSLFASDRPITVFEQWINDVLEFKYHSASDITVYNLNLGYEYDIPKTLLRLREKEQNDDGIFVCMYISYICSSLECDFLPTDIKLLRKWVEYELRQNTSILPPDNYPPGIDLIIEEPDESDSEVSST